MKRLKKNQRMTVEAYVCACGTPDMCVAACAGNVPAMGNAAAAVAAGMSAAKA